MRAAIHEYRPVHRSHELNVICLDFATQGILLFKDANASQTAPLMRRRVWPALVLGRFPDRFRRGFGAHASCGIERDTEIVAQRRLSRLTQRSRVFVALE